MATELPQDDMHAFYEFLGRRLDDGDVLTPEESVEEFRRYQVELQRFINETSRAAEQGDRGESKPLDVGKLMNRVFNRTANQESSD
jgi:hypothetical protein